MLVSSKDMQEFQRIIDEANAPPPPVQAPFATQVARGAVSGATLGMLKPFADAGQGGFPETLGNILGVGAGYVPLVRGVGAGLAGLGAAGRAMGKAGMGEALARLLPPGVEGGTAAANLLAGTGRQLGKNLSSGGQILAHTVAGGAAAGLPELLGTEDRSAAGALMSTALGAGLGALGGRLGVKHPAARAGGRVGDVHGVAQGAAKDLWGASDRIIVLETAKAAAERELFDAQGRLISAGTKEERAAWKARIRGLQDQIKTFDGDITKIKLTKPLAPAPEQLGLFDQGALPGQEASVGVQPDLFGPIGAMSSKVPPIPGAEAGLAKPIQGEQMSLLNRGVLPKMDELMPAGPSQSDLFGPIMNKAESSINKGPGVGEIFDDLGVGITSGKPFGWRKPSLLDSSENLSGSHELGLADAIAVRRRLGAALNVDPGVIDPTRIMSGVDAVRRGKSYVLPHDLNIQARILDDIPFGDYTLGCMYGSFCRRDDAEHLLRPGWSPKGAVSWLARKIITPRWVLAGTAAEGLPRLLAETEGRSAQIKEKLFEAVSPILGWSPETKQTVQKLFYQHMKSEPDQFFQAVRAQAPEAIDGLPVLQDVFDNMRTDMVRYGALRPEQRFLNYFPVARERRMVTQEGTMQIEMGGGEYMPIPIQNLISPRNPVFARTRTLSGPEHFPEKIGFDDTLKLYFSQYSRFRSLREAEPELNKILANTPEEHKQYVADLVNFWMGDPSTANRMSDMGRYMRQFQFMRTIGFSVLSPITNTFQRLNTFAVVSPNSFFQAFKDMRDPERLKMMGSAGLGNLLGKFEVGEDVVGGGMLSNLAQKLEKYSGALFSMSENQNKKHAFMAGLREAESRGLAGEKAVDFAKNVMWDTQFIQTRANVPEAFRGEFGRTIGQFQTYRINQTHFLARLVDEAAEGSKMLLGGDVRGAMPKMSPLLKYLTASVAMGGGGAVMLGDWGEEKLTRLALGRAAKIPGIPEFLGLSLQSQMALGSINADDLNSFLFFLPGPTATYLQGLIGNISGVSFGRGLDMSQAGRDLTFDERMRFLLQSLPAGGLQTSRIINALRLYQNDGEFRRAMDVSEALGKAPPSGELLSSHASDMIQILGAAVGFPSAPRLNELRTLERQRDITSARQKVQQQAADYWVAGNYDHAMKLIDRYNRNYEPEGAAPLAGPNVASLKNATQRRLVPPGYRMRPPGDLLGAEPFER